MPFKASSKYPAGLASAYTDHPPEGISEKVNVWNHKDALRRQLLVWRGYPAQQMNSCGVIGAATHHGQFVSPPGAESMVVTFSVQRSDLDPAANAGGIVFTVTYNSAAKTNTITGDVNTGPSVVNLEFGPWALASVSTDPGMQGVLFLCDVEVNVFNIRAEFSNMALS